MKSISGDRPQVPFSAEDEAELVRLLALHYIASRQLCQSMAGTEEGYEDLEAMSRRAEMLIYEIRAHSSNQPYPKPRRPQGREYRDDRVSFLRSMFG